MIIYLFQISIHIKFKNSRITYILLVLLNIIIHNLCYKTFNSKIREQNLKSRLFLISLDKGQLRTTGYCKLS